MVLILSNNEELEVESMNKGVNVPSGGEHADGTITTTLFFNVPDGEDINTYLVKINKLLTAINITGAQLKRDDGKKMPLGCTKVESVVMRVTDFEWLISAVLV